MGEAVSVWGWCGMVLRTVVVLISFACAYGPASAKTSNSDAAITYRFLASIPQTRWRVVDLSCLAIIKDHYYTELTMRDTRPKSAFLHHRSAGESAMGCAIEKVYRGQWSVAENRYELLRCN
jgi:hypothetical protein